MVGIRTSGLTGSSMPVTPMRVMSLKMKSSSSQSGSPLTPTSLIAPVSPGNEYRWQIQILQLLILKYLLESTGQLNLVVLGFKGQVIHAFD